MVYVGGDGFGPMGYCLRELARGAHTSVPLWVGAGTLAGALIPRRYGVRGFVSVALLGLLWWAVLVLRDPPHGSNFSIYRANAERTLRGEPTFRRSPPPGISPAPKGNRPTSLHYTGVDDPRYLDYSGAQHAIYVLLASMDLTALNRRLQGAGFQLWSLLLLLAAALTVRGARFVESDAARFTQRTRIVALLAFHPVFTLSWLVLAWEDKLVHFVLPLAVIVLISRRRLDAAALLAGVGTALNGTLAFFLPAFVLYVIRTAPKRAGRMSLLLAVGLAVGLAPFFPSSLAGWQNRLYRLGAPQPFWFSIYHLLPAGWYSPALGKMLALGIALGANVAFAFGRLGLSDVALVSVGASLTLGPDNVVERVIPLIALVAALTRGAGRGYWISVAGVLSIYFGLLIGFSPERIRPVHVAAFYLPLAWVVYGYIKSRISQGTRRLQIHVADGIASETAP